MDERRTAVLRAVVESFIDNAQPVGSQTVLQNSELGVSAATIRNDLVALEAEGFLAKPHTSAGRIPTEAGYRCFVDLIEVDLIKPGRQDAALTRQIKAFFKHAQGQIEQRLDDTSKLLSDLTTYTAVVLAPSLEREIIRSATLTDLGDGRLVFVVLTSSGAIKTCQVKATAQQAAAQQVTAQKTTAQLPTDPPVVDEASRRLSEALVGVACSEVLSAGVLSSDVLKIAHTGNPASRNPANGDLAVDILIDATIASWHSQDTAEQELYVGGAADITEQFEAMTTVKAVLKVLEEQLLLVRLLRSLADSGLSVAIGSETGVRPLKECAIVASPYVVDGETVGSIGVVGPTRMDYPKAMAAVNLVGERLGDSLAADSLAAGSLAASRS